MSVKRDECGQGADSMWQDCCYSVVGHRDGSKYRLSRTA